MNQPFRRAAALIICCIGLSCLTSCGHQNQLSDTPVYEAGSYTLLIYMCGSSLETKKGAATKNIAEMLSVELPANTNVVIQTGGAAKWRDYDIPNNKSCRYLLRNNQLELVEATPLNNMGATETLHSFLTFGLTNYPAEQTALIFWDHGGGAAVGVCMDEQNQNDLLTLTEISSALKRAELPKKLAFVGFDACLMANYETACILSPYSEKMLASEELEPAKGWDYPSLLSHLNDLDRVLSDYAERNRQCDYFTLSLIDLTKLEPVHDLFRIELNGDA